MLKIALISLQASPLGLAGVHRSRLLCNALHKHGVKVALIKAESECQGYDEDISIKAVSRDPDFLFECGAIDHKLTRTLGFSDIGIRTIPYMKNALCSVKRQFDPDVFLITSSPCYPMLFAGYIKKNFNVPVILDFQDPWVSASGTTRQRWSKGWLAHRLAVALEPRALQHASFITGITERQNKEMAARYPWLDASRMAAIPIGGDPDDFVALRANPPLAPQVQLDPGLINLSYVGAFLPRAVGPMRAVFAALRALRETNPALAERIRLNFVGTSNQPSGEGGHLVMTHAAAESVSDHVREHPARVPYMEALSLLANSNGLLMIGSDEPHYSASKIYPGLMSGTPYLSIFHSASSAHQILSSAGGGAAHCFASPPELAALVPELTQSLTRLATTPFSFGQADAATYEPFTAHEVAGQFARIFERVRI